MEAYTVPGIKLTTKDCTTIYNAHQLINKMSTYFKEETNPLLYHDILSAQSALQNLREHRIIVFNKDEKDDYINALV